MNFPSDIYTYANIVIVLCAGDHTNISYELIHTYARTYIHTHAYTYRSCTHTDHACMHTYIQTCIDTDHVRMHT